VSVSAAGRRFTTVLVANRGEIARRVFRTARAMGHRCVAVYVDADAGAPFVTEADEAVRLPSGYLDGGAVIDAARAAGAEAVHPGYGFLAENAAFAADVLAAGLVWVGPPPAVIDAMGDKLAAKRAAVDAGVPTLPSSDDPRGGDEVGYPLLVKAAAGGGGKGMRTVASPGELADAVAAARREAAGAFGDDRVFLERSVPRARHVEIQILADGHGGLVHLGERECSIQRRHQKIVEESPSPVVTPEMRAAMGDAALRLARAIGYESAGTVEFLVDDATRDFFFLEVNTRLQVEHPVTEEVTGLDLVREQLRIAAGEPLGYAQDDVAFRGHAIEVRLYAEDPAAGFLPATGTLAAFEPAADPAVRWESGVAPGSVVGVEFDPMLAKVVAHAATRHEAAGRLALALERLHVGGVTTNRHFLAATLRHPAFLEGDTTTDFIDRARPALTLTLGDDELRRAATVAALWLQGENRAHATVLRSLPTGWRNARLPPQRVGLRHGDREIEIRYAPRRDGTFALDPVPGAPGEHGTARVHHWSPDAVDAEVDGHRARARVTRTGSRLHVQTGRGTVDFDLVARFVAPGTGGPVGGFVAPMPGVVLEVRVTVGEHVVSGQTLVVLEAMKMEHHVSAPVDGVVAEVRVEPGQQVDTGAVLLVIDPVEEAAS
jgi:propionyl-CoA carboxylase alpha chain